eukprot:UN30474
MNVNIKDQNGNTPLHHAIFKGANAVQAVLEKTANIDVRNKQGETALVWSVGRGDIEISKILIEHGANSKIKIGGQTLAHIAAMCPNDAMLPYLHERCDISLVEVNGLGQTPLIKAAENARHQIIQWLLRKNCDPLEKDRTKSIPLHYAVKNQNSISVQTLLNHPKADKQLSMKDADEKNCFTVV